MMRKTSQDRHPPRENVRSGHEECVKDVSVDLSGMSPRVHTLSRWERALLILNRIPLRHLHELFDLLRTHWNAAERSDFQNEINDGLGQPLLHGHFLQTRGRRLSGVFGRK